MQLKSLPPISIKELPQFLRLTTLEIILTTAGIIQTPSRLFRSDRLYISSCKHYYDFTELKKMLENHLSISTKTQATHIFY